MPWREGGTHARVLQLCWRLRPHHLLPGTTLLPSPALCQQLLEEQQGALQCPVPPLPLPNCFSHGTCCAALCSTSPAQPPCWSTPAARECWAASFPSCSLLSRPSWTTSTSSRTSPGTTVWPTCWKPLSGCSAQIPSSGTDAVGCSSCLHCASWGTGEWSWTPLAMCRIREAAHPSCSKGGKVGAVPGTGLSCPQLPGMGVWGHQGLELCSAGLCWPPGVVLMLNFYK